MDIQEEAAKKELRLATRATELTASKVAKLLGWLLENYKNRNGIVSMKSLTKDGQELIKANVNIGDLKKFNKICKKYKVRFSAFKDTAKGDYVIFFKAQSKDQMQAVYNEFAKEMLKGDKDVDKEREPLQIKIDRAKEEQNKQQKSQPEKTKSRGKTKQRSVPSK